ncbi:hypothetical protein [Streptomyces odonnellii]|uniref:hypothetical protein n=1 Tax=Streptomyces odonnellii TaxID=1417980 RepID=UPI000696106B|nr:hypothetical protein [Streptomyces odonnellii]
MNWPGAYESGRPQRLGPGGRWTRAAVFTLTSGVLAAVGHHLASEEPVPWLRLLAVMAVIGLVSSLGAGRVRSWWAVTAVTGGAQLVLHTALSAPAAPGHGHAHGHAGAGAGYAAYHSATAMTLAHCGAAVAVALLMHRADRALSGLPRTVGRWARAGVALVTAALGRWPAPIRTVASIRWIPQHTATAPGAEALLSHVVERRGPPGSRAGDAFP